MAVKVVLKKGYNNTAVRGGTRALNGDQWYESQAYRALNQVMGRCLRHKGDWGAVILADERFHPNAGGPSSGLRHVSKWIRAGIRSGHDFPDFKAQLNSFVGQHHAPTKAKEEPPSPDKPMETDGTPVKSANTSMMNML